MKQIARSTFKTLRSEETLFGKSEGGPELIRGTFVIAYEGGLQGEGVLEELKIIFSQKRASMMGLMRFTGRLGEFQGSFVLKHSGKLVNGRVTSTQTVVPGSATGNLKGLRGEMKLERDPAHDSSAAFRYHFA